MSTPEIIEYYVPSDLQFGEDIFKCEVYTDDEDEYISHTDITVTLRDRHRDYEVFDYPRRKIDAIRIQMESLIKIRDDMNRAIISLDAQLKEEAAKK